MYAVLAVVVHAMFGSMAAFAIAPHSPDPIATATTLWELSMGSVAMSAIGLVSTASYLSRRLRPKSGVLVGLLCGALCGAIFGLTMAGIDFSLIVYLATLAPTLLAVLLASLLDRPKSGWQT